MNDVDCASSMTLPNLVVPKKSPCRLQAKWSVHSFRCQDNETLTRLRIERIKRQIQEIKLQTQNDIQYQKEEVEKQKYNYRRKLDSMEDSIKALSHLLVDVVKQLRDQQQSLLDEKSKLENRMKSELSVQANLTKEYQEVNDCTTQMMKDISISQLRFFRLATYVESLNNLQATIRATFPVDGTHAHKK